MSQAKKPKYLLVADDVIGGYFALNGGSLGNNIGKIYYYSSKDLTWHNLNFTYTEFLAWALNGDVEAFYQGLFWKNWQDDVKQLDGNQVFVFTPDLNQDRKIAIDERQNRKSILKPITKQTLQKKINLIWRIPSHN